MHEKFPFGSVTAVTADDRVATLVHIFQNGLQDHLWNEVAMRRKVVPINPMLM